MKEPVSVYKLKDDVDVNKFGELGYDIVPLPDSSVVLIKLVPQDFNSDLVQGSLAGIYNNPDFINRIYTPNKKTFVDGCGLTYDKNGKAKLTKKFVSMLTTWRIQIEPFGDKWIGFSSMDPYDSRIYYASRHLEQYCTEDMKLLKDNDLIERILVQEADDEN